MEVLHNMEIIAWSNKEGIKWKGIFYHERNSVCKRLSIKEHYRVANFLNRYFKLYKNLKYIPKAEMSLIDSTIIKLYKEYSKENFEAILEYIKFNEIEKLDNQEFKNKFFIFFDNKDLEDFSYDFRLKHLAKIKIESKLTAIKQDLKQQYIYLQKHINKYILKYTIDGKNYVIEFETKSKDITNKTVAKFQAFNKLFGIEIDVVLYASSKENIKKIKDCEKTKFPIQFLKFLDKD